MFREEMPRLYEVHDLIGAQGNAPMPFLSFPKDDSGFKQAFLAYELELQKVDADAWEFLKAEVNLRRNEFVGSDRGRQQIMSILNQARAYNYLVKIGCIHLRFIPEEKKNGQKTPDLEGVLDGQKVLCEVKTLHISELEMDRRKGGEASKTNRPDDRLYIKFICEKLKSCICEAIAQISSYSDAYDVRRIVFILINFDEFFTNKKTEYYSQIDRWLATDIISGIDIVFYNQITPHHEFVSMKHAQVINQPFYEVE